MWKVEVWIYPVRGVDRKIITPGRWQFLSEIETFEAALETVIKTAKQQGVSQAHRAGALEGEVCGMRAYAEKGYCFWTGSGGCPK